MATAKKAKPTAEQAEYLDKLLKYFRNPDPESAARMAHGPELYRKGMLDFTLVEADGKTPYNGPAEVKFKQISHEYEFGCNGFMLEQFDTEKENAEYAKHFKELFNMMTIPFYWADLEPEPGKPRYDKNSPKIYRRPPPDLLLEFCEKNGITPKGHVLLYDQHTSKWLKRDTTEHLKQIYERHVREIAERYGDRIYNWDVTNEVVYHMPSQIIPEDFAHFAFEIAEKYLPHCARLNYNDGNSWRDNYGFYTFDNMLENWLISSGHKVDCIGLQMHMIGNFKAKDMLPWWGEYYFKPEHWNNLLDIWQKVGKPTTISEVTVTAREDIGPDCEDFQAYVSEMLYKIWFSHPNTNGIIWWNLVDDTALGIENESKGGLLRRDMTEKPVYKALKKLILKDWHTEEKIAYNPSARQNHVRGFYGNYEVTVKLPNGKTFKTTEPIVKGRKNITKIVLK